MRLAQKRFAVIKNGKVIKTASAYTTTEQELQQQYNDCQIKSYYHYGNL